MRKPRALAPGDRVAVVAPASPFSREEFDSGLQEIRRLGFVPVYDDSVFARQRYVAGSAAVRAAAIHEAWRDPSIAGVIGVRGGYGSAQLLPGAEHDRGHHRVQRNGVPGLRVRLISLRLGPGHLNVIPRMHKATISSLTSLVP